MERVWRGVEGDFLKFIYKAVIGCKMSLFKVIFKNFGGGFVEGCGGGGVSFHLYNI